MRCGVGLVVGPEGGEGERRGAGGGGVRCGVGLVVGPEGREGKRRGAGGGGGVRAFDVVPGSAFRVRRSWTYDGGAGDFLRWSRFAGGFFHQLQRCK